MPNGIPDEINVNDFWSFCCALADGRSLTTTSQARTFSLSQAIDGNLTVTPDSTQKPRPIKYKEVKAVIGSFRVSRSFRPADYLEDTRNASYILTLLERYIKRGRT